MLVVVLLPYDAPVKKQIRIYPEDTFVCDRWFGLIILTLKIKQEKSENRKCVSDEFCRLVVLPQNVKA